MSEVVENLIVKAGKSLPEESEISGETIQKWKMYTIQYFKISPDFYLINNEFYQSLSNKMQVRLVTDSLSPK